MFRYGQHYSDVVWKNKGNFGLRQQSNKLILFQGLSFNFVIKYYTQHLVVNGIPHVI